MTLRLGFRAGLEGHGQSWSRPCLVEIWDLATGRRLGSRSMVDGPVSVLCFSGDGTGLAATNPEGRALSLDGRDARVLGCLAIDPA
jgi:hypothetical protein